MTEVVLYGFPGSTYVRSARLALLEKGVAFRLEPAGKECPHPYGKMPTMKHGDLVLFESMAIARYVDEGFDGPALQPRDARQRAVMAQWTSVATDYLYTTLARGIILPRFIYPQRGIPTDEAAVKKAGETAVAQLQPLEQALQGHAFIVGDTVTLADLFAYPILDYYSLTPEGKAALPAMPSLTAWLARMRERPSVKSLAA